MIKIQRRAYNSSESLLHRLRTRPRPGKQTVSHGRDWLAAGCRDATCPPEMIADTRHGRRARARVRERYGSSRMRTWTYVCVLLRRARIPPPSAAKIVVKKTGKVENRKISENSCQGPDGSVVDSWSRMCCGDVDVATKIGDRRYYFSVVLCSNNQQLLQHNGMNCVAM